MLTIWDDLECYYQRYGTETWFCCSLSRYSDRQWYYEDCEDVLPTVTRCILEQAYNDAKHMGLQPNVYQCRVVCANDLFFPEMSAHQVLVSYLLDDRKTLISQTWESLSKDVYCQRAVHVYLSVTETR